MQPPARRPTGALLRRLLALAAGLLVSAYLALGIAYWIYSWPKDDLLPFTEGFESGDLRQWQRLGWRQLCCAYSMQVVQAPEPVASGRHAARFELRRGDPDVRGNQRAEVRLPAAALNGEYRYAFSVWLPPDWVADPLPVNLVQWHSVSDKLLLEGGPSMPLRLAVIGDRWIIDNFWDSQWVTKFAYLPEHPQGNRLLWSQPIEAGRWVRFEFQVRWKSEGDGRVQVWKDGQRIVDAAGPNTYRDLIAPYMKFGVYVPAWSVESMQSSVRRRVAYFDDIEFTRVAPPP